MPPIRLRLIPSPVGPLLLGALGHRLALCLSCGDGNRKQAEDRARCALPHWRDTFSWQADEADDSAALLALAEQRLGEYFAGRREAFCVPLADSALLGATPFQAAVWEVLDAIPFGQTATYGEVARAIGHPAAVRAVGGACRINPLCIFRPCHRVIGADGRLTGFAGGLEMKARLLAIEQESLLTKIKR